MHHRHGIFARELPRKQNISLIVSRSATSGWRRLRIGLLAEANGSVRRAAAEAGVDAVTLYRLLRKRRVKYGRQ